MTAQVPAVDHPVGFGRIPARTTKGAIFSVLAVLSLGLLGYALHTGTPMKYWDEREYLNIAVNVLNGKGIGLNGNPTAYRPPVWPLVLAFFLWLGLPTSMLSIVPALAMIAAAVVASMLGMKIMRAPLGAIAGIPVLLYPINVYTGVRLYPQALATLLILLLWLAACWVLEGEEGRARRPWTSALVVGFAGSALALSVPTLAFTAAAVVGWLIWCIRRRSGALLTIVSLIGSFLAPIAAWAIRNMVVFGSFIPLTTSNGQNLLLGNNPNATGSSGVGADISSQLKDAAGLGEVQTDKFLRNAALDWIGHHPVDALNLYFAKFVNYFSPYNQPATASEGSGMRWIAIAGVVGLVALFVARLWWRKYVPLDCSERFFIGLFFANAFVMAVYFTRPRFRQPLDSILLVEAGIAIAVGLALWLARGKERAAVESESA